jgi:hypothetical protein
MFEIRLGFPMLGSKARGMQRAETSHVYVPRFATVFWRVETIRASKL